MDKKMVCLFVDVELAKEMMGNEIELVRDLLGYGPRLGDVKAAHDKLSNVLRCLEDIEAREQREE